MIHRTLRIYRRRPTMELISHLIKNIRQVSVTSGAILAGASDDDIKQCEIFATKIGLAFQS